MEFVLEMELASETLGIQEKTDQIKTALMIVQGILARLLLQLANVFEMKSYIMELMIEALFSA